MKRKYYITKVSLIWHYIKNEESQEEIAEIIGCSEGTIRNNLIKTKIKIRRRGCRKGYQQTASHKKKIGLKLRSKNNGNYVDGRTNKKYYCIDCRKKISIGSKRCKSCTQLGEKNSMYGKCGRSAPNYIHGKGYEPYPAKFTEQLKEQIRKRDDYKCQKCSKKQSELKGFYKKLDVHHIDYNKENCEDNNLIALCKQCNMEVNKNKDYWFAYFTYIMGDRNV